MSEVSKPLTRNQTLVLDALSATAAPQSAYDLLDRLRDEGLRAPLQVYRALEKLTALGLAHRLESLNAFVACAKPHCHLGGLVAFAICQNCGHVHEFSDTVVSERLKEWTLGQHFVTQSTVLELRGLCAKCAEISAKEESA